MPSSVPSNDQKLVERAQAGDAAAFEALMKPYYGSLRRIAHSFCRDWAEADDLAQEALLKVFRSLGTFASDSTLKPWVFSVTRSVCTDWYRRQQAQRHRLEVPFDDEVSELVQDDLETLVRAKDEAERLWGAIRCLNPTFRVPLVLFDIEGLSYEEVARIERVPVGTIRSRLSRGRARLQELLRAEPSEFADPKRSSRASSSRPWRLQSER